MTQSPQQPPSPPRAMWLALAAVVAAVVIACGVVAVAMSGESKEMPTASTLTNLPAPVLIPASTAPTSARTTSQTPRGDQISDTVYLKMLDSKGITYASKDSAIRLAHAICDGLDKGMNADTVGLVIAAEGFSLTESGHIAGAAVGSYCPEHIPN